MKLFFVEIFFCVRLVILHTLLRLSSPFAILVGTFSLCCVVCSLIISSSDLFLRFISIPLRSATTFSFFWFLSGDYEKSRVQAQSYRGRMRGEYSP